VPDKVEVTAEAIANRAISSVLGRVTREICAGITLVIDWGWLVQELVHVYLTSGNKVIASSRAGAAVPSSASAR